MAVPISEQVVAKRKVCGLHKQMLKGKASLTVGVKTFANNTIVCGPFSQI